MKRIFKKIVDFRDGKIVIFHFEMKEVKWKAQKKEVMR